MAESPTQGAGGVGDHRLRSTRPHRATVPSNQVVELEEGAVVAKRGFFAELNHQAQQAERRRRQQEAQTVRMLNAAVREHERAVKAAERAKAAAARASAAQQKAAFAEASRLHTDARVAEVEAMNKDLEASYADIDGLLEWTLETDDFVDLESLRAAVDHPPFLPGSLSAAIPPVPPLAYPPEPVFDEPEPPKGLARALGGKKRHAEAVAVARTDHQCKIQLWSDNNNRLYTDHIADLRAREERETARLEKLEEAQAAYRSECAQREAEVAARNEELSKLINDLAFDVESAIEEYVGLVLSNSVYPEAFPVAHDYSFDLSSRELTLQVDIPEPSTLPSAKGYRYVKARDEITSTQLSLKAQKDRYASALHQVALRSLHEVFEADRSGKIHSIALTVGVHRISPATGQPEYIALVVVAADRSTFNAFDLANVVPAATLQHLGAALSKSPFELTPADTSHGVRKRSK